ncbi:hypothetical protein CONPUDRAFT_147554 [Coniophora puteana RWD-64-598 SS2]|uniref:F-box domain-containing protein n=1 Tax=Coniophora puteana (strain RWD-64-598) TaxID=741705 RepID=A0A5M3M896_CONPW|nr:uncharacterized protein CONPUDRAFT_147554 [Coniophora puteana RWD-64-598 SS2]EIW75020.1 hypothetical protein CONPUDRAFT_147554 [Coniophora puteana RWD-64-598 SS2]
MGVRTIEGDRCEVRPPIFAEIECDRLSTPYGPCQLQLFGNGSRTGCKTDITLAKVDWIDYNPDYPTYPVSKSLSSLHLNLRNVCQHWRLAVDSCTPLQHRRVFFVAAIAAEDARENDSNDDVDWSIVRQTREVVLVGPASRIIHVLAQYSPAESITSSLNIQVTSGDQTQFNFPSTIPTVSLPQLTSLHLESVAFDWNTRHHCFSRLTHLSLCDIINRPHTLQLVKTLALMPALQGLILRGALPKLHDIVPPHTSFGYSQQVDLPRLRYLRLQGSVAECFNVLSDLQSLDRLAYLGLECFQGVMTPAFAFGQLRDLLHGQSQRLMHDYSTLSVSRTDQVAVELSTWRRDESYSTPASQGLYFWYISSMPPVVILREMARATLLTNVRQVTVSGYQNHENDLRDALADMPAVHSLTVSDMNSDALSTVLSPDELEVPVPELKELIVQHGPFCHDKAHKSLVACISERQARRSRLQTLLLCGECNMAEDIRIALSALEMHITVESV